jgi:hypothetical protein
MSAPQPESRRQRVADLLLEAASAGREALTAPEEIGYFGLAWRRLRRDRTAMLGAVLVALISLARSSHPPSRRTIPPSNSATASRPTANPCPARC